MTPRTMPSVEKNLAANLRRTYAAEINERGAQRGGGAQFNRRELSAGGRNYA